MTAFRVPEIWCDECLDRTQADTEETVAEFRQALHRKGWVSVYREVAGEKKLRDFCDDCAYSFDIPTQGLRVVR